MKKFVLVLSLSLIVIAPTFAHAQTPQVTPTKDQVTPTKSAAPTTIQTPTAAAHLENPLKGVNSIGDLFYKVANFILSLSYIVIAFFLILSGFKFVAARGNDKELENAKNTFKYTIIGAFLIIGAQTIIAIVRTVIEKLQS